MTAILTALREQASRFPARLALTDERQSLTFARVLECVHARTDKLQELGSQVVGILADNSIDWMLTDLAALAGGMTLVPIPPWFTVAQRRYLIEASRIDTLLVDDHDAATGVHYDFEPVTERLGRLTVLRNQRWPDAGSMTASATAKITFTSGSTGQPKGVRLARDTIDQVAVRLQRIFADLTIDRHLCVMPLATLLENVAGLYVPLMLGASVHVPSISALGLIGSSRFDARRFRDTLDACEAQSVILTPQLLRALTASLLRDSSHNESLKFVAVGGARVSDSDLEAAARVGIPAYQGYGLSECASVVAINRPGDQRAGSVGRPLPGVGVVVSDDGEILVSNQCMHGYLGEPDVQVSTVATGDLGYLDEDGFLYVTGRRKNMFITSYGRNVAPEWPETELLAQHEIAQVCVFGEARPENIAVIVPANDSVTRAAIARAVQLANRALPDYAQVAEWLIADEPFSPANGQLTATGKPIRDAIAVRYLVDFRPADARVASRPLPTSFERTDHGFL